MTPYIQLLDKHEMLVCFLKSLLASQLTKEQEAILYSFLLDGLLAKELDPIKESISKRLETNLKAMDSTMKVDALAKYLNI